MSYKDLRQRKRHKSGDDKIKTEVIKSKTEAEDGERNGRGTEGGGATSPSSHIPNSQTGSSVS